MPHSTPPLSTAIVVVSDRLERSDDGGAYPLFPAPSAPGDGAPAPDVVGGYLERLPLAAVRHGLAEFAEIWHHRTGPTRSYCRETPHLARRVFPADADDAPYRSRAMVDFIAQHGAPRILCVWGLGVSEDLLEACAGSVILYNSIDAPALRVPAHISRHFDLVLTGAQWQSDAVTDRHPEMTTTVMPIGPEFASPQTFFPTGAAKRYDLIYVAAAQAYKRHDILFAAMAQAPRRLSALCVMGYGEDADALRREASTRGLDVEFVGPPGVSHDAVNRLMNAARVGVVCGVDDGAPAILTEYMLAGLPVVANAALACGLQYISPGTGLIAPADRFEDALIAALDHPERFSPRQAVIDRWAWPHSIARLERLLGAGPKFPTHLARSGRLQGGSFEPAASA